MKHPVILLILTTVTLLSLSGCTTTQNTTENNLQGTWYHDLGGTITIQENNQLIIRDLLELQKISLNGAYTYTITNNTITLQNQTSTTTLNFNQPDDNTIELSDDFGMTIILERQ